ncbi:hypothetical protein QF038_003120 [Pseudarthrobacter sp. W1I19]|uniref:hypothetical protein n=1 Tax=Pseudarthrobacter sp. W1I19 TaxID=3042288 RepID=UPI002786F742|nr:hypothetical protein [Pseudarthrobacter sp. W1I19]MDQ0924612.1 hypothetical protein [Pseudarthrobacter sp. W1I19]
MTTPELPGASSQQTAPHQQPQFPPMPPRYGPPSATGPQEYAKAKKQRNVIGLVALSAAIVGFIFACIPGALIIGWVLLPIGFILAIVSLFLKDKAKGMGITALILSIVGTIVGFAVFFSVVTSSAKDAFGSGDTKVSAPTAEAGGDAQAAAAAAPAAKAGTRENPSPIGSVVESKDWKVVVNSVTLGASDAVVAANRFNDAPAAGSEYILVNYSATYVGDDANGQTPSFVSVDYVTADGKTINAYDHHVVAPEAIDSNTLYKGGTATGNIAIQVPTATTSQGVLAVRPGMIADKVFVAVK